MWCALTKASGVPGIDRSVGGPGSLGAVGGHVASRPPRGGRASESAAADLALKPHCESPKTPASQPGSRRVDSPALYRRDIRGRNGIREPEWAGMIRSESWAGSSRAAGCSGDARRRDVGVSGSVAGRAGRGPNSVAGGADGGEHARTRASRSGPARWGLHRARAPCGAHRKPRARQRVRRRG